jgi:CoA:oxalate CoA-transferase
MGPLEGIRIIDLSRHLAGPYSSTVLSDMGAEVIRIERPGGDDDRKYGFRLLNGDSSAFMSRVRNKKSMTLNLRSPEGQEIFRRLVEISDVVLENYGVAGRRELNIEYEVLQQVNPKIILASISGYGSWGPAARKLSFDAIAQAACGSMSLNGFPGDERPMRTALNWVDYSTGLHTAVGILVTLWYREKTGKGQHVDVALYDTATSLVGMQGIFTDYILYGHELQKTGNATPYAYADTFQAKDGWIFIHLLRDSIWRRFIKLLGREELGDDPRFNSDAKRAENRGLINEVVKPWVAQKTVDEITHLLEEQRVPCQKVNTIPHVLADPQLKAREMLLDADYPGKGKVPISGTVIKLSESPGRKENRIPLLGEHNEEILGKIGYSKEERAKLKERGII